MPRDNEKWKRKSNIIDTAILENKPKVVIFEYSIMANLYRSSVMKSSTWTRAEIELTEISGDELENVFETISKMEVRVCLDNYSIFKRKSLVFWEQI